MAKDNKRERHNFCNCCKEYDSDDDCSEHSDQYDKCHKPKVVNCKPNVIVRRPKIIKCEPTIIKYKPVIIKCRPKTIKWYKPEVIHCDSDTKIIGHKPKVRCHKC